MWARRTLRVPRLWLVSLWIGMFRCFFWSRRRHTRYIGDWSSDVCSSDLWEGARASGAAINMDRAGAAQRHAAAELRTCVIQFIANHPEQRSVSVQLNNDVFTVYVDVHGDRKSVV